MALHQLSREDSFEVFVFRKLRKFHSLILCEGLTEKKVVDRIIAKLSLTLERVDIGVMECGGIPHIYDIATVIISLLRIAQKVHKIGLIIDSEELDIESRLQSFIDSLRSRGIQIKGIDRVDVQLYRVCIMKPKVELYIAVNGIHSYNFEKHDIHDHGLCIAQSLSIIKASEIHRIRVAKELINAEKLYELIDRADITVIETCFRHIVQMLYKILA